MQYLLFKGVLLIIILTFLTEAMSIDQDLNIVEQTLDSTVTLDTNGNVISKTLYTRTSETVRKVTKTAGQDSVVVIEHFDQNKRIIRAESSDTNFAFVTYYYSNNYLDRIEYRKDSLLSSGLTTKAVYVRNVNGRIESDTIIAYLIYPPAIFFQTRSYGNNNQLLLMRNSSNGYITIDSLSYDTIGNRIFLKTCEATGFARHQSIYTFSNDVLVKREWKALDGIDRGVNYNNTTIYYYANTMSTFRERVRNQKILRIVSDESFYTLNGAKVAKRSMAKVPCVSKNGRVEWRVH
jgi:hypothetical protein